MNHLQPMIIIAAIAVYKTKGVIAAMTYLMVNADMASQEAIDMIALYDRLEDGSQAGRL